MICEERCPHISANAGKKMKSNGADKQCIAQKREAKTPSLSQFFFEELENVDIFVCIYCMLSSCFMQLDYISLIVGKVCSLIV